MGNLANFEAFKLNKVQMNAIAGGAHCHVTIVNEDGSKTFVTADYPSGMSKDEAYDAIHDKYDGMFGSGSVIVGC